MDNLKIQNLSSNRGDFSLKDINLDIQNNEYFVLLGQSGSGKTMLLETIAGLNTCSGNIIYKGKEISLVATEKRDIGFVYQDFALFPNLNVQENIRFSSRYKKIEKSDELFKDIVEFLKLETLLERDTQDLSGGEKQRVAIARAIFSRPKILLLDEPLSAIDPTFRNAIMKSLKDIHRRYNVITIHVTHNFREASYLADKIAIIMDGEIKQVGAAKDVLNHPANIEVAKFLGFKNIFPATMLGYESSTKVYSVDPNVIKVSKDDDIQADYIFEGVVDECMGIVDHYKLFVKVKQHQFFIKILKRDYEGCYTDRTKTIQIGFDKKDISFI
ncbi:ATP-binding cassette domain-containing protein [Candidatus Sulfurimonas marisnigri]|uniref:ATP-binding cassette domain-containing protein n=1 Tax=Candidatus Sulfurimonas marisnigri TaxID=2740405 RepID=A0A7S7LZE7_9BACT|nr:ATP-binding cassette domain-containing protein [Candidatus Sulfurimonas marisnigri]QOY53688.1 ATP-binding cassette domain-containing protein [Candidatus Sulfurimonas marisnigri]